jgi:hypothetical protein
MPDDADTLETSLAQEFGGLQLAIQQMQLAIQHINSAGGALIAARRQERAEAAAEIAELKLKQIDGSDKTSERDVIITEAMTAAGVGALLSYRQDASCSDLVVAIYTAMRLLEYRAPPDEDIEEKLNISED